MNNNEQVTPARPCVALSVAFLSGLILLAGCTRDVVSDNSAHPAKLFRYSEADLGDAFTPVADVVMDLQLGGPDSTDTMSQFYRPTAIDVDPAGSIFVLDNGNSRIQVFDRTGEYQRTIGNEGQGPGEFGWGTGLVVVNDLIVLTDQRNRRISTWHVDGSFAGTAQTDSVNLLSRLSGLEDGTFIGFFSYEDAALFRRRRGFYRAAMVRLSTDGAEMSRSFNSELRLEPIPTGIPRAATDGGSRVYVAAADRYQITAMEMRDESVEWTVEVDLRSEVSASEGLVGSPVVNLGVDGHGHVYVWRRGERGGDSRVFPVDVFSAEGTLLASGGIEVPNFHTALGEHVYGLSRHEETHEMVVRRYAMKERF